MIDIYMTFPAAQVSLTLTIELRSIRARNVAIARSSEIRNSQLTMNGYLPSDFCVGWCRRQLLNYIASSSRLVDVHVDVNVMASRRRRRRRRSPLCHDVIYSNVLTRPGCLPPHRPEAHQPVVVVDKGVAGTLHLVPSHNPLNSAWPVINAKHAALPKVCLIMYAPLPRCRTPDAGMVRRLLALPK